MKSLALFAALAVLQFGFVEPQPTSPKFTKAIVTHVDEYKSNNKPKEWLVTDRKKIAKLASFFPGMGRGKKAKFARSWEPEYLIDFERSTGKPLKISTYDKGRYWSEGAGDWPARPGLKKYMDKLLAAESEQDTDKNGSR